MGYRALKKGWNDEQSPNYQSGWVYGTYLGLDDRNGHSSDRIYTGAAVYKDGELIPEWTEVDPATLCCMTEQNDRLHRAIFEGDIVINREGQMGTVFYSGRGNGFGWFVQYEKADKESGSTVKTMELGIISDTLTVIGDTYHHRIVEGSPTLEAK